MKSAPETGWLLQDISGYDLSLVAFLFSEPSRQAATPGREEIE